MHAKPDLRVFLKWMINRSGSVITDVILRNYRASAMFVKCKGMQPVACRNASIATSMLVQHVVFADLGSKH